MKMNYEVNTWSVADDASEMTLLMLVHLGASSSSVNNTVWRECGTSLNFYLLSQVNILLDIIFLLHIDNIS